MIELFEPYGCEVGEAFMRDHCYQCIKYPHSSDAKKQCNIMGRAMGFHVEDKEYPNEWRIVDGNPTCTAYKNREEFNTERRGNRKNLIRRQDNGTLSLF